VSQPEHTVHIGIDIGGTFTDFVMVDEGTGALMLEKTLSTPADLWQGIQAGLAKLDPKTGLDLAETRLIVHGTTVGLNTFLERKGHPTGLITTQGFRDVCMTCSISSRSRSSPESAGWKCASDLMNMVRW
jgi:N-methylhydantoinase A/oxoprolinase/acetone carboxylase beta subunit